MYEEYEIKRKCTVCGRKDCTFIVCQSCKKDTCLSTCSRYDGVFKLDNGRINWNMVCIQCCNAFRLPASSEGERNRIIADIKQRR